MAPQVFSVGEPAWRPPCSGGSFLEALLSQAPRNRPGLYSGNYGRIGRVAATGHAQPRVT